MGLPSLRPAQSNQRRNVDVKADTANSLLPSERAYGFLAVKHGEPTVGRAGVRLLELRRPQAEGH
jgi:hypothetical protein